MIDDGRGDADILDMFNHPEKPKPKVKITYPWEYDEDVIATNESMKTAEALTGKKLSKEGVKNGGLDMIFHYDNTKTVWERDLPYGATWGDISSYEGHRKKDTNMDHWAGAPKKK